MKLLAFLFFTLFTVFNFKSQANIRAFKYDINNGLIDNWINDFEVDKKGFLWIATNNGVSRFDGYNFINFSAKDYPLIPNNTQFEDLQFHGELIYAISQLKGIFTINTTNFEVHQLEKNGVVSYFKNENKELIYHSNGQLTYKLNGKIKKSKNFGDTSLNGKVILVGDTVYFNRSFTSFFKLDLNFNIKSHFSLKKNAHGLSLCSHPTLGILFGTSKGLFKEKNNTFIEIGEHTPENKYSFYGVTPEGKHFYVYNTKQPIFPKGNSKHLFTFENIKNVEVRTVYYLGKEHWLIGTNQGFYKLKLTTPFISSFKDDYTKEDQIRVRRKIISDNKDLYLLGYPEIVNYDLKKSLLKSLTNKNLSVYDAEKIGHNIFATSEGFGFWKFNTKTNNLEKIISKEISDFEHYVAIKKLNENKLILGGKGNIVIYDVVTNESKKFLFNKEIVIFDIDFIPGKPNEIVFATNKGLFEAKINLTHSKPKLQFVLKYNPNCSIKDILLYKKKEFWLATDQGIIVMNQDLTKVIQLFKSKQEITNVKVTGLIQDRKGRIWASTYSGITCIDPKNKNHYLIGAKSGLLNLEYNYKSFEILSNGQLIFGGLFGYDIIDPDKFNFKIAKTKIIFSGFNVDNPLNKISNFIEMNKDIRFQTGKEDLLLYFSTSDFNNAELYSMEYSINNGEWLKLSTNNVLRISNLSGGKHAIAVRLRDLFGNICHVKKFNLIAIIPFYQEIYFYVSLIILVLTLSFLTIYYFRQMRMVEVETKNRIAMDLHDETGTILTRVLLMSKSESIVVKNLDVFQSSLKEALFSLRSFMDSLSGKEGSLSDLVIEIQELVQSSFKDTGHKTKVETSITYDAFISAELYRDIKLCMYEVIQNTLKHAYSTHFTVKVNQEKNKLLIYVSDDGKTLFPIEELENRGNGMRNLKKRTKRHDGLVQIEQIGENNSLNLKFEFPLN